MQELTLDISGMHCTACSLLIDDALEDIDGVTNAQTAFAQSKTTVSFDPKKVTSQELIACVTNLGYQVAQAE